MSKPRLRLDGLDGRVGVSTGSMSEWLLAAGDNEPVTIEVQPYDPAWPVQFERLAGELRRALANVPGARVEHVGSTSVPGLAAKPVLDVDVLVARDQVGRAVAALESIGYVHRGDLGVTDREAFHAPDDSPRRHVYVCVAGTLHVRNHLAVREVLRTRPDLRDAYAEVKTRLAAQPGIDIDTYLAGKSAVLQDVLAASDLTAAERRQIWALNDPSVTADPAVAGADPAQQPAAD